MHDHELRLSLASTTDHQMVKKKNDRMVVLLKVEWLLNLKKRVRGPAR